ncbi:hypothetical protein [Anaeromyxobacter sp. PSR-1]|uniref:hypothetical protein n=1 Tax=unclassified Anaeromyxobacter TaxID=2620896 RepID=UPI0005DC0352|nr:hypothetical protein [Anaeromyxobacter sp. PSR-1]GAO03577.1 hypothetical protein PSR1_02461 [Anaeromyxobacter sp. PSR-1]
MLRPAAPAAAVLLALLGMLGPGAAHAEATGGCHCFRDRTFEPERPAAADPYILATARSSLLSAAYGPPKRELVAAVMGGRPAEDLWIAHGAAARTGADAADLLALRDRSGGWKAALAGKPALGKDLEAALARGASDAELAGVIVDATLVKRLGADPARLREARAAGAGSEELIVLTLLSARTGRPELARLVQVKAGKATWGGVLHEAGIAPKDLDALVRQSVR